MLPEEGSDWRPINRGRNERSGDAEIVSEEEQQIVDKCKDLEG